MIKTNQRIAFHFKPFARTHFSRQRQGAIADAHQATHGDAVGFPQTSHLTVTTRVQSTIKPAVGAVAADFGDAVELKDFAFHLDAREHRGDILLRGRTQHTHGVATRNFVAGMRESVGQFAIIGEQHQTAGGQIEAPDHHPPLGGRWQQLKNTGAAFWIVARAHHIGRFMNADDPTLH